MVDRVGTIHVPSALVNDTPNAVAPVDPEDDSVAAEVPAKAAVLIGTGSAVLAVVADLDLDIDACPIHTVRVGDDDGWAQLAMRSLGMGDESLFDEYASACIIEVQEANALEPTGEVSGATWAFILPAIKRGDEPGFELGIARRLLGLAHAGTWDDEFAAALEKASGGPTDAIVDYIWLELIENRLVA